MAGESRHSVLIFDGDCAFCTTTAHWAATSFRHGERIQSAQSLGDQELESWGLSRQDVGRAAWWVDADGRLARGHRAVGRALQAGGGGRRAAGWIVVTPPASWVAAGLYRLVVRWRHRLPGATPACRVDDGPRQITR